MWCKPQHRRQWFIRRRAFASFWSRFGWNDGAPTGTVSGTTTGLYFTRVGNGGAINVGADFLASFYDGDPAAGGSLLLIPLACSLFGISNDVAMQVVAVGFVISILQDSAETALNSSTDVVFTAAVAQKQM